MVKKRVGLTRDMKRMTMAAAAAALLLTGAPAIAQSGGVDGYVLVESLRSGDDAKALELLKANPVLVNSSDGKGDTPLLVTIRKRDEAWIGYLLNNKADPNIAGANGETPLLLASRIGFDTAVEWLLSMGAKVDAANRQGETALIIAVQQRQLSVVKTLLENGANPDKADAAAGYSARDYAKRDTRSPQILRLIEAAKPAAR